MPRVKAEAVHSDDAGHPVARCKSALAAAQALNNVQGSSPNTMLERYWAQQLDYATEREAREAEARKRDTWR